MLNNGLLPQLQLYCKDVNADLLFFTLFLYFFKQSQEDVYNTEIENNTMLQVC